VPVVGVNHLRAHAWSPFIALHAAEPAGFDPALAKLLPHLGLIVSGGNTILFSISATAGSGRSRPPATTPPGEALDKGAKLLGIGYPGGPAIERLAAGAGATPSTSRAGIGSGADLDFSFSGLKTSLRYRVQAMSEAEVGVPCRPLRELPGGRRRRARGEDGRGAHPRGLPERRALGRGCQQPALRASIGAVAAEAGAASSPPSRSTPATTPE
jgi:hypothetical protein